MMTFLFNLRIGFRIWHHKRRLAKIEHNIVKCGKILMKADTIKKDPATEVVLKQANSILVVSRLYQERLRQEIRSLETLLQSFNRVRIQH